MSEHDIAIIGAGPAGISVALSLRDRGLRPLLIDRADQVGSSWRGRYDRLKLNTGRPFSHLPNRPYPQGTPMFPSRDEVVAHVDRHAHEDGIELRMETEVTRIDRHARGWRLATSDGETDSRQVVVAIGNQHTAHMPQWPGGNEFTGELMHSSEYRNPRPYQGKRVFVVGSGSSGMEIAHVDGSRLDPHAVVLATGYVRGLGPLVGHLGVLDAKGKPLVVGERPAAEGLRFIGYDVRPSLIGYMAKQSKRMAKRIARELSAA